MGQGSPNLFENNIFANMRSGVRPGGFMLTKRIAACCNFQHGARVVDIGCGTGTTVEYLRDVGGLYAIGVDLSALLVEQGKKRTGDLQLIQSSGEELPFDDHSFDGVLAECSLSVMSDVGRVFAEMNRILVPGGKLGITDLYARDRSCNFGACNSSGIMTYNEMAQVLRDHGFKIMVFEDQSRFLKEFVVKFIMEHGSAEELWQCAGIEKSDKKTYKLGYYLLIAEKCS
ncbi:MAG: Methyltransferase type 11 [Firmicutes bacterium]|nr:Methyltransferase type 11 [Bacillota bacterium]